MITDNISKNNVIKKMNKYGMDISLYQSNQNMNSKIYEEQQLAAEALNSMKFNAIQCYRKK